MKSGAVGDGNVAGDAACAVETLPRAWPGMWLASVAVGNTLAGHSAALVALAPPSPAFAVVALCPRGGVCAAGTFAPTRGLSRRQTAVCGPLKRAERRLPKSFRTDSRIDGTFDSGGLCLVCWGRPLEFQAMPRPESPAASAARTPDRDGTRFRVRFHHDLQRQDLYFHTEKAARRDRAGQARTTGRAEPPLSRCRQRVLRRQRALPVDRNRDVSRAACPHHDLSGPVHRSRFGQLTPRRCRAVPKAVERPSPKTGKPMAAASHRFYLALVKGMFTWAVQRLREHNPFADVQPVGRVRGRQAAASHRRSQAVHRRSLRRYDQKGSELALALWSRC